MTSSTKAEYGGIAGAVLVLLMGILSRLPGWESLSPDEIGATKVVVGYLIVRAAVYYAPQNKVMLDPTEVHLLHKQQE